MSDLIQTSDEFCSQHGFDLDTPGIGDCPVCEKEAIVLDRVTSGTNCWCIVLFHDSDNYDDIYARDIVAEGTNAAEAVEAAAQDGLIRDGEQIETIYIITRKEYEWHQAGKPMPEEESEGD